MGPIACFLFAFYCSVTWIPCDWRFRFARITQDISFEVSIEFFDLIANRIKMPRWNAHPFILNMMKMCISSSRFSIAITHLWKQKNKNECEWQSVSALVNFLHRIMSRCEYVNYLKYVSIRGNHVRNVYLFLWTIILLKLSVFRMLCTSFPFFFFMHNFNHLFAKYCYKYVDYPRDSHNSMRFQQIKEFAYEYYLEHSHFNSINVSWSEKLFAIFWFLIIIFQYEW